MKHEPKPHVEGLDEKARFYVIFSELAKADEQQDCSNVSSDEMNEIEQVMRMVVDVNDEPPQFVTST
ncbi:MAG: hypothetical protein JWO71_1702 [Candidatus Acidoferrum typicum]|nr:hypothetical protein [Candidatus Acidoferrum typicum]